MSENGRVILIGTEDGFLTRTKSELQQHYGLNLDTFNLRDGDLRTLEGDVEPTTVYVFHVVGDEELAGSGLIEFLRPQLSRCEVVFLGSGEPSSPSRKQIPFFHCLPNAPTLSELHLAIEFARKHGECRHEGRKLQQMAELFARLNSLTSPDEAFGLACKAAVEILQVDHSGLVQFDRSLSKGKVVAEYPTDSLTKAIGLEIAVKNIPAEQELVLQRRIINIYDLSMDTSLGEVGDILRGLGVKSILVVPVVLEEKVIASFSLDSVRSNRDFTAREISLCEALGNQVAIAVKRAQWIKEFSLLDEIGREINSAAALTISEMIEKIRAQVGRIINTRNFYIARYDEQENTYSLLYFDDEKDNAASFDVGDLKNGLTDLVRREKKTKLVNESANRMLVTSGDITLVGTQAKSWLGTPLIVDDKVVGVMAVQSYKDENAFDENDRDILDTIGSYTAIAIRNAHLHEDTQHRMAGLQLLNKLMERLNSKVDEEELLQTMVREITDLLKCSHCTIFRPKRMNGRTVLCPAVTFGEGADRVFTRPPFEVGQGFVGWVFKEETPILSKDVGKDSRFTPFRSEPPLKPHSMLVVPIKAGKRTVGVISANQGGASSFGDYDQELLVNLGLQAGYVIERAVALKLLHRVGTDILNAEDEGNIIDQIVMGAVQITNTTAGCIGILSEDQTSLVKRYTFPQGVDLPYPRINNPDGMTRAVIATGSPVKITQLASDPRVNPYLLSKHKAMLAMPLKVENKVIGVLYLLDDVSRDFTELEVNLLETLASQAVIAIRKARLLREAKDQRDSRVKAVQEIIRSINGPTKLRSILEGILNWTRLLIPDTTLVQILLARNEVQKLEVMTSRGKRIKKQYREIDFTQGVVGRAAVQRKVVVVDDVLKYKQYLSAHERTRSEIAVPMMRGSGELLGVLNIESSQVGAFREKSEVELVQAIAQFVVVAWQNTELYVELNTSLKELRALTKRAASNQEIMTRSSIAADVVHHINNLAGTIPIWTSKIRSSLGGPSKSNQLIREYLSQIDSDFDSLKIASDQFKAPLRLKNLDVNSLLETLVQQISLQTKWDNILVDMKISPNLYRVRAVYYHFATAVKEIIINGMESMRKGGKITIHANNSRGQEGKLVVISIEDEGLGIPPELRERIFDLSYSTKHRRCGFGLWRTRSFIEQIGGTIKAVKPSKEIGAKFVIRVPGLD